MKHSPLVLLLGLTLTLGACSGAKPAVAPTGSGALSSQPAKASVPGKVSYTLKINEADATKKKALQAMSENTVNRIAQSMGTAITAQAIDETGPDPVLSMTVKDSDAIPTLTSILQSPFTFNIMKAGSASGADITVEGKGGTKMGFYKTAITESSLDWVTASAVPNSQQGTIMLAFTPAGHTLLASLFKANQGQNLGLFVRNHLVSTMQVTDATPKEQISIEGVPSFAIAQVFADDVDTGLHVKFVAGK